jgi:hypothetical protein
MIIVLIMILILMILILIIEWKWASSTNGILLPEQFPIPSRMPNLSIFKWQQPGTRASDR